MLPINKFLLPLLIFAVSAGAGNLLPDASFELGGTDYAKMRFSDLSGPEPHRYLAPVADEESKVHGKVSLRFDNPDRQPAGLRSPEFRLRPETTYTFSFYARSDKSVELRAMILSIADTPEAVKGKRGWDRHMQTFALSRDWKRYSLTFKTMKRHEYYLADLTWGRNNSASVWLDAWQVNQGSEAEPFTPASSVEFTLDGPRQLQTAGEPPLACTLRGINYGSAPVKSTVNFTEADDYSGAALRRFSETVDIPAAGTVSRELTIPGEKFGVFSLAGSFRTAEGERAILPFCFSRAGRYEVRPLNPDRDFMLGIEESYGFAYPDLNGGTSFFRFAEADFDEFERIDRQQGKRFLRLGNGLDKTFMWRQLEVAPGKFDFTRSDFLVDRARQRGDFILGVLGHAFQKRYMPDHVAQKATERTDMRKVFSHYPAHPDLEDWRRYVRAVAEHYRGRIQYWEILNEVNLFADAATYIKYLKITHEELRAIDPAIRIVAPDVTGDLGGVMGDFLEAFGEAGGFQFTDIVSFHPYSSREEISPKPAPEAIRELRRLLDRYKPGIPLWNTELYYLKETRDKWNTLNDAGAGRLVRRLLIDLGEGVGQSMLIPSEYSYRVDRNPNYDYIIERVVRRRIPSEFYVAGNAFARMLEGAKPLRKLPTPPGVTLYLYRNREGKETAALWSFRPELKFVLIPPKNAVLKRFDLFGNPLAAVPEVPVTMDPVYFTGEGLSGLLEQSIFQSESPFAVTGSRWFADGSQPAAAVEILNCTDRPLPVEVKLQRAPGATPATGTGRKLTLAPYAREIVLLPVRPANRERLEGGRAEVLIRSGEKTGILPLFLEPIRFAAAGKTLRVTGQSPRFQFCASARPEGFHLNVQVDDPVRGGFTPGAPWNDDSVEIFLDRTPLENLPHAGYTAGNLQLFLRPPAAGKKATLDVIMGKIDKSRLRWSCRDTPEGYRAEITIPWKELGADSPTPVSFDLTVNNDDGQARKSVSIWSGTGDNFRDRTRFGLFLP